jgi:NADPH-dependent glutamate synthase beta subunit-like oxidoreductase
MGFDVAKFETATFEDRTESIPVPILARFFDEGAEPVWVVRGLTGMECALAKQAVRASKNLEVAVESLLEGKLNKKNIKELKAALGFSSDNVPEELVQRYTWIECGSVNPVCSHEMAMKLAVNFPEDFFDITNKIMGLTGDGRLGE